MMMVYRCKYIFPYCSTLVATVDIQKGTGEFLLRFGKVQRCPTIYRGIHKYPEVSKYTVVSHNIQRYYRGTEVSHNVQSYPIIYRDPTIFHKVKKIDHMYAVMAW